MLYFGLIYNCRKDGFLSEVFDNMMDVIQAIYKNAHAVKEGHFILLKFRVYVFKAMEEQDIVCKFFNFVSIMCMITNQ